MLKQILNLSNPRLNVLFCKYKIVEKEWRSMISMYSISCDTNISWKFYHQYSQVWKFIKCSGVFLFALFSHNFIQ